MEELFELKDLLLKGDIPGALAIVEELEEMSYDDKINNIRSFVSILVLHLIKQQAEKRTTRSWDVAIRNCVLEIQHRNKRRKTGGVYLTPEDLRGAIEEAYPIAINAASLQVDEGRYYPDELSQIVNKEEIIDRAMDLISQVES